MSGLCGWIGSPRAGGGIGADVGADVGSYRGAQHQDARQLLSKMAAPLARFDGSGVHELVGDASAAAVAAAPGAVQLHREHGLLVALWGRASLMSPVAHKGTEDTAARMAQLWRRDGAGACAALRGPFALCILDEVNGEALLAIDRSGTHGLSFQASAAGLVFASSADALIAHPAARRDIDPQAIYNYLYFHVIPAPDAIYQGQQRLLPGEYLHYRRGNVTRAKYWRMEFDEHQRLPFNVLKQQFLQTLHTSVQDACNGSGHGVGAFLSGGTDSSTLAAILGKVSGRAARTYSIGFDAPGYDEMDYARLASRHFGTEHHELYVTADDVVAAIPKIAAIFDQPFGNASAVPAFYCAQMARADGISCLLGGDGGDELFGGNERYARQAVFSRYQRVPALLRRALIEPLLCKLGAGQRHALLAKARSYVEQASVPLPARLETYNLLQRYGNGEVLESDFLASIDPGLPLHHLDHIYGLGHGHSQINQMLALDLKFTLADNDLPKVVKACELAGVEAAFPFLNEAMVAFSSRLAPHQKLRGTRLRYFFKEALQDVLPRAILRKQKHGFGLPFGLWLQQHHALKELAFDSLNDLKARRIVRADFIDSLLSQRLAQHPGYHGTMVWVLMMLEQWFLQRQR